MERLIRRVGSLVMGEPPQPRKFYPVGGFWYESVTDAHYRNSHLMKEGIDVTSSPNIAYLVHVQSCDGSDPESDEKVTRTVRQELRAGLHFTIGPWHTVKARKSTMEGYENGFMFHCTKAECSWILVVGPGFAFEYDPQTREKFDLKQHAQDGVISMDSFKHWSCFYGSVPKRKAQVEQPEIPQKPVETPQKPVEIPQKRVERLPKPMERLPKPPVTPISVTPVPVTSLPVTTLAPVTSAPVTSVPVGSAPVKKRPGKTLRTTESTRRLV